MTREIVLDILQDISSRRQDEKYSLGVLNEIYMWLQDQSIFDYPALRQFISSKEPTKLGGREALEVTKVLGFLKNELSTAKKKLKKTQ